MTVAKVLELICEGPSIEEALQKGIDTASKTVDSITHVDVEHIHAHVKDGKITDYRVIAKVSFVVK